MQEKSKVLYKVCGFWVFNDQEFAAMPAAFCELFGEDGVYAVISKLFLEGGKIRYEVRCHQNRKLVVTADTIDNSKAEFIRKIKELYDIKPRQCNCTSEAENLSYKAYLCDLISCASEMTNLQFAEMLDKISAYLKHQNNTPKGKGV